MRPPPRLVELVVVVALLAGGTWLRWCHLGTPSLWWDEIVHVRIAERPTVRDVWRTARNGAAPGSGNAGAVPLDYLVLHAWLATTDPPAPEAMERHYRTPAFAFAVAALPLAWMLGRMVGGPVVGTLALGLFAGSMPAVLYAAEARFYSLWLLATVANLLAFTALLRRPSAGRLVVFVATSVLSVLAGLYGVFPLAAEYVVIAVLAWRSRGTRMLGAAVASGISVAAVLALWIPATSVRFSYGRGTAGLDVQTACEIALRFFAGHDATVAAAFAAAFVLAPLVARRDRTAGALTAVFVLSACAVPVMVAIAHAKQYYFHPRHALFLLPMMHLALAIVVGRAIARLVAAPAAGAVAGALAALVVVVPTARAYVADPHAYFRWSKTLRDYRGLARTLAERTASGGDGAGYLVLLEKGRPGHLANPTLAFYLERYGLADRVMLAGLDDPARAIAKLPALCADGCRGPKPRALEPALRLRNAFDQSAFMRKLLALRVLPFRDELLGVGVVAWAPTRPPAPPGVRVTRLYALTLFEATGTAR